MAAAAGAHTTEPRRLISVMTAGANAICFGQPTSSGVLGGRVTTVAAPVWVLGLRLYGYGLQPPAACLGIMQSELHLVHKLSKPAILPEEDVGFRVVQYHPKGARRSVIHRVS